MEEGVVVLKPLVSIIITTKNEEKHIGLLLKSIKEQSYGNLEIIVVDNNSIDKTKKIARKFTKLVFNFGPERSAQRNYGAQKAKGKYLLFLDADMELTKGVVADTVRAAEEKKVVALVIPEKTVGKGFIPRIRRFEREMYLGDLSIEVARFFANKVFKEMKGYDLELTGPEDYDLHYRIAKKYKIERSYEYILHHEEGLGIRQLLRKKYYYAGKGAKYAQKHPELIASQGTIIFRKAYLRNWQKFVKEPLVGICFIGVRILETIWAVAGYINAVGLKEFGRSLLKVVKLV